MAQNCPKKGNEKDVVNYMKHKVEERIELPQLREVNNLMWLECFGNSGVYALLDTGSNVNLIRRSCVEEWKALRPSRVSET